MKKKMKTVCAAVLIGLMCLTAGCGKDVSSEELAGQSDVQTEAAGAEEADQGDSAGTQTVYPCTVTDDFGEEVTLNAEPERIVSLAPAQTEIVCALGASDRLVGRSEIDDYPAEVSGIASAGVYYEPNVEMIISKAPQLVISANYMEDSVREQLEKAGVVVYVCYDSGIDAAENNIKQIGALLNENDAAMDIINSMEETRNFVAEKCAAADPKKVFIDIGDYYSVGPGSLLDSMLREINAVNVTSDTETAWPQLSAEQVIALDPEVYISMYSSVDEIKAMNGFDTMAAVLDDEVYLFDTFSDEANMIQRSGPRLAEGLEILAKTIYPELF